MLAFSPDANQKYIFDINQNTAKVEIIDREAGKVVSSFGRVGQLPGEFNQIHGIAADTQGQYLPRREPWPASAQVPYRRAVKHQTPAGAVRRPLGSAFRKWRKNPNYVAAHDALQDEFAVAAALMEARGEADMTQEQSPR